MCSYRVTQPLIDGFKMLNMPTYGTYRSWSVASIHVHCLNADLIRLWNVDLNNVNMICTHAIYHQLPAGLMGSFIWSGNWLIRQILAIRHHKRQHKIAPHSWWLHQLLLWLHWVPFKTQTMQLAFNLVLNSVGAGREREKIRMSCQWNLKAED